MVTTGAADRLYIDHVGRESFYGLLALMRGQLFEDEEFAELYCADSGRDSVPPSLLATALLLQPYDRANDAEAKQGADFDIRTYDGRWRWVSKWKTGRSPRVRFSCFERV